MACTNPCSCCKGACCTAGVCTQATCEDCEPAGVYQGAGTSCDPNPCEACDPCTDCDWPADIDEYGTGGCSVRYTGLASRNATVTGIINGHFTAGRISWNSGYPAAISGCMYAWWFLEADTSAGQCDPPAGDTYCDRYIFKIFLLRCNADGSTTDITADAVTATDPSYLHEDRCRDDDTGSDCPCSPEPSVCAMCNVEPAEVVMDCPP